MAGRYGASGGELQARWEERLGDLVEAAHLRAGGAQDARPDDRLVALITVRDGPRVALLLLPDEAFAAAMGAVGIDVGARSHGCLPGRLLEGVGGMLRRIA